MCARWAVTSVCIACLDEWFLCTYLEIADRLLFARSRALSVAVSVISWLLVRFLTLQEHEARNEPSYEVTPRILITRPL